MSKIYSALAGLCLSVLALGAQPVHAQVTPQHYVRCGTEEANDLQQRELKRLNPNYNSARVSGTYVPVARTTVNYTLPVVVHVINSSEAVGTGTNLSQAQVQSQLDVLNEDYRKLNPDGATVVPSVYQPARADAMVQFVAARVDPSGNPMAEPGIDRVDRNVKGWTAPPYAMAYIQSTIKPATSWDPSKYINIWVMNLGGGLLGYAQFPDNTANLGGLSASGGAANTDGVVILYSAYGSRAKVPGGTYIASYDKGRTLTHELGLRHIWGDATCGTDYCNDTPTQQTSNYGCPTFPHVTCSNVTGDQSMNYMDYVDDACMAMFSNDQVSRIQAIMGAGTPRRSTLITSNVACPNGVVTATAANNGPGCAGGSVNLTATGPAGATYAWTGPNGYTSTQQNPVLTNVTTAMSGTYTVTVSVTTGACPGVASTSVVVNSAAPTPTLATTFANVCPGGTATLSATNLTPGALINENFNGAATGWTLGNNGTASTAFQYITPPYTYSSTYLVFSNYSLDGTRFVLANSDSGGSGSTTNTTLTSPAFSTMGYNALQVTFQQYLAYGTGDAATVEASTDGGATWTTVTSYTAVQGTATAPATTVLNLNAYTNRASLQLRWRYVTSWSYAWAIDNVAVTGTTTPITYAWSLVSGNGLPATVNTASLVVSPTVASVYRLTVNYTGSPCTATATIGVGVSAGAAPVTASNSGPVCAGVGSTVTLTASTLANTTYAWTGPNGYTSTQQSPVLTNVTANMSGVYTVTATPTGSSCSSTASTTVVINPTPPTPALAATAPSVCAGSPSTLSASNLAGQTGLVYTWTLVSGNGLPTTTTGATLTVTPTTPSVYRLTLGYAGSTCTSTATVAVNATQPLPAITASSNTPTCTGSTLTLSATSIANATYAWTGPNGYTSTQQNPTLTNVTVAAAGTYTVVASVAGNNCTSTATTTVSVLPIPVLAATSTTVALGSTTTLSATNLTGLSNVVYSWGLISGNGIPAVTTGPTITVKPTRASVYQLTIYYPGGSCTTSATISVGVSVSQWVASAYPVPFRADGVSVQVDTDTAGPLTVRMYDIMGRKVYDQELGNAEVGRNTVLLPNSGSLQTGKYVIIVEQSGRNAHINVLREAF